MNDSPTVVLLLFPGIAQLDLTGPAGVLSLIPGAGIHLAAASADPVPTDSGFSIVPTCTFGDAPPADIFIVPGGPGVFRLMQDAPTCRFITGAAQGAVLTAGVCTGSFLLGRCGLLDGHRVTTHWASRDLLREYTDGHGVTVTDDRVVVDRDLVTCAGVTSGIDLALEIVGLVSGQAIRAKAELVTEHLTAVGPDPADADRYVPEIVARFTHSVAAERRPLLQTAPVPGTTGAGTRQETTGTEGEEVQ